MVNVLILIVMASMMIPAAHAMPSRPGGGPYDKGKGQHAYSPQGGNQAQYDWRGQAGRHQPGQQPHSPQMPRGGVSPDCCHRAI